MTFKSYLSLITLAVCLWTGSLHYTFADTANKFLRTPVIEEFSGNWCQWCSRGIVATDSLKRRFGNRAISIAIHCGRDPLAYKEYEYNIGHKGVPSARLNRTSDLNVTVEDFAKYVAEEVNTPALGIINITARYANTEKTALTVDIESEFKRNYYSTVNYSLILVEDSILGPPQTNGYGGGTSGTYYGLEELPFTYFPYFNDVARYVYPSFKGEILVKNPHKGRVYKTTQTFSLPTNISDKRNLRIIALLINPNGEIMNASTTEYFDRDQETTGIQSTTNSKWKVYATSGQLTIEGTSPVLPIEIFNTDGTLVYKGAKHTHKLPIGIYLVRSGKEVRKVFVP